MMDVWNLLYFRNFDFPQLSPLQVSGDGAISGAADTMMHKFWDSVLNLDPPDNESETNRYSPR